MDSTPFTWGYYTHMWHSFSGYISCQSIAHYEATTCLWSSDYI